MDVAGLPGTITAPCRSPWGHWGILDGGILSGRGHQSVDAGERVCDPAIIDMFSSTPAFPSTSSSRR